MNCAGSNDRRWESWLTTERDFAEHDLARLSYDCDKQLISSGEEQLGLAAEDYLDLRPVPPTSFNYVGGSGCRYCLRRKHRGQIGTMEQEGLLHRDRGVHYWLPLPQNEGFNFELWNLNKTPKTFLASVMLTDWTFPTKLERSMC